MRRRRPVVTSNNKYRIGLAALLGALALYSITNSFGFREPERFPPTWLDEAMPLLPVTVWIYASFAFLLVSAFLLEKNCARLQRFLCAELAANIVSAVVYVSWPTTFARPALTSEHTVSVAALELVWSLDAPVNCFPSLHVSMSLLSALLLWRSRSRLRVAFLLWAVAISLSTMTTKQHHVADVFGGALVAAAMYWWFLAPGGPGGSPASASTPGSGHEARPCQGPEDCW